MANKKVYIIGVTPRGLASLSQEAIRNIDDADIVFGGRRLLDMFPDIAAKKTVISGNLPEIIEAIRENIGKINIAILASGDPGFFGIAGYLSGKIGKGNIIVVPNVSSVQTAFARIGESWQDAAFASTHGRDIESIVPLIVESAKTAILTDEKNSPGAIAQYLLDHGYFEFRAYVCQELDSDSEKIEEMKLEEMVERSFSPLSVLVLIQEKNKAVFIPGIDDEEFFRRKPEKGLITRQEIRAISLSKLRLQADCVVWDIGAGSGAVSVEASLIAPRSRVYAIEKNPEDIENIRKNVRKFGRYNINIIAATAPESLDMLPDPNAVFIGGSAGNMKEIISHIAERIHTGGRIVINVVTLENLNTAVLSLKEAGFYPDITFANIARSSAILDLTRLQALNPVFIITAEAGKKENNE